jgi:hypothetical protein
MFSETTISWYAHGNHQGSYSDLELIGIMIYDTKTGRFVSNRRLADRILNFLRGSDLSLSFESTRWMNQS